MYTHTLNRGPLKLLPITRRFRTVLVPSIGNFMSASRVPDLVSLILCLWLVLMALLFVLGTIGNLVKSNLSS